MNYIIITCTLVYTGRHTFLPVSWPDDNTLAGNDDRQVASCSKHDAPRLTVLFFCTIQIYLLYADRVRRVPLHLFSGRMASIVLSCLSQSRLAIKR